MKKTKDKPKPKHTQRIQIPPPYFPITFEKYSTGEGYPCDYCTLLFVSKRDLILHMKNYPSTLADSKVNDSRPLRTSMSQSCNAYQSKYGN